MGLVEFPRPLIFSIEVRIIPIENFEFKSMSLTNIATGEEVMKVDGIRGVEITTDSQIDYDLVLHRVSRICRNNAKMTMTFSTDEPMDTEKFYKIIGYDQSNLPDKYDIQFQKFVQARKHKKRRINKKWLKRYGYKTIWVDTKGWKMHLGTDGSVEFIKDYDKTYL